MGNRSTTGRQRDITKAAVLYASGQDQTEIAKDLGCHQATVSKMLSTSQAKKVLEKEASKYLNSLGTISDSTITQINTTNKIHHAIAGQPGTMPEVFKAKEGYDLNTALKYIDLTSRREERILSGHGLIGGSNNVSIHIANIYNDNRTVTLNPDILKAIGNAIQFSNDTDEVIEIVNSK